jgi:2-C-methyl-D-erythritol 4-phosphate cytidylyltransferase
VEPDSGVVIAAAGAGRRFGGAKQFLSLAGRPALHHSLDAFSALEDVARIAVVVGSAEIEEARALVAQWDASREGGRKPAILVVPGGARRQDSVLEGLRALSRSHDAAPARSHDPAAAGPVTFVLVHDAARPLILAADVRRVLDAVKARGAAAIGTPSHDSVKRARDGVIVEDLPREEVWTVQTPQGARLDVLEAAYVKGSATDWTDEASALRAAGVPVTIVEGSRENLKITRPGDEALAEAILLARRRPPADRPQAQGSY